jgi:catechol 2,3-dioxygenase-like lactoylglutathione lyase family enzyme
LAALDAPITGRRTRGAAVTTKGFEHLYVETHNWSKAVEFWQRLGFVLDFDTGHGSGMLSNPTGGPTVFLAEQSIEDPLATELYLAAGPEYVAPDGIEVVSPFVDSHWGTKVMVIQDPDGHRYRIQAPA